MKDKTHVCWCHGCGIFHVIVAAFLSTGAVRIGQRRSFPMYACPDCRKRRDNTIRLAFLGKVRPIRWGRMMRAIHGPSWGLQEPCTLCGVADGTYNEHGAHNLCQARADRGMATPALLPQPDSMGAMSTTTGSEATRPEMQAASAIGRYLRAVGTA